MVRCEPWLEKEALPWLTVGPTGLACAVDRSDSSVNDTGIAQNFTRIKLIWVWSSQKVLNVTSL